MSLQSGRQMMSTTMTSEEQRVVKQQILAAFEHGCSVPDLLSTTAVPLHRATVYRLHQRFQTDPETGLISALSQALPTDARAPRRLAHAKLITRRQSLLTLLFLPAVGLQRPCDLSRYTGDALGLLTGRRRAYGFWQVERFLSQVARSGGDETLTDALAAW